MQANEVIKFRGSPYAVYEIIQVSLLFFAILIFWHDIHAVLICLFLAIPCSLMLFQSLHKNIIEFHPDKLLLYLPIAKIPYKNIIAVSRIDKRKAYIQVEFPDGISKEIKLPLAMLSTGNINKIIALIEQHTKLQATQSSESTLNVKQI